jgi:hypothetical protein
MITLILSLFFAASGYSQEFLARSKLLQRHQLSLIPLEQNGTKEFLLKVVPENSAPLALLADSGELLPLTKKTGAKEISLQADSCGEKLRSFPYELTKEAKGTFALLGKPPKELSIQWEPFASDDGQELRCKVQKKGYELSQLQRAKDSQGKRYYFAEWDSPKKVEFEKLHKKLGEKVYDQHSPDCRVAEYSTQSVGTIVDKDKCSPLLTHPVDCDGMGYQKGSFGKPLGRVLIRFQKQSEEWIIFESSGYEGDAFLGIEKSKKQKVEFYIYSGC